MKNSFHRYSKYVLCVFVFIFALSLIHWIGDGAFDGPSRAEAKITRDMASLDDDNPEIKSVMAIQDRHASHLMAIHDVIGTATGLSEDGKPAILVFTRQKVEAGAIPENLEGIPIIVKVTGEIIAMRCPPSSTDPIDPKATFSLPVPIGVSTGNVTALQCDTGTIAARVKDTQGNVYALSNNHVYALENTASIGNDILQPGLYDAGCSGGSTGNIIGTLSNYVPIIFNTACNPPKKTTGCNKVDAAIASSSLNQLCNSTPINGYGIPSSTTVKASSNQQVMKYGRTTLLTKGTISGINATVKVSYGAGLFATFINQITVSSSTVFISAGDSGSLLVTYPNANPAGLLFAGNSSGTLAIANQIGDVLNSLSSAGCSNCVSAPGLAIDGQ